MFKLRKNNVLNNKMSFFKKFFQFFGKKIKSYRKETVTVMIVPHNQKGVKNYNISFFRLIICLFLILSFFSFSLITVSRYIYYLSREKIYFAAHNKYMKQMGDLINNSGKLINAQENFNRTLNHLLSISGLKSAISLNTGLGGPLTNIQDLMNNHQIAKEDQPILEDVQEINGLKSMSDNAQQDKLKIQKLAKKMKSFEVVMRYIPSLWPLDGNGKIEKTQNGVMEVNTLPYTRVIATAEGKIAGIIFTSLGFKITIIHKYQFVTMYNGLFEVSKNLKKNETVHKGDVIGYVANNKGKSILKYGLFIGNEKGLYPLDPTQFSFLGR